MSDKSVNLLIIPLDDRPVSYTLPKQIAMINRSINVFEPPRELLGGLTRFSDVEEIFNWLQDILRTQKSDYIIVSLDTIAYGGLISSRRSTDNTLQILDRLNKFRQIIENSNTEAKILAFSSIMRISDSYVNEEEKEYWDKYGKEIYKYSYLSHKENKVPEELIKRIPDDILDDYLKTRERNLTVNKFYLSWLQDNFLDYLVYSKDDTGQFGLNVLEAELLSNKISEKNLQNKAVILTGADEIPCDLTSRAITDKYAKSIKIFPVFSTQNGKNVISRYEDKTIFDNTNSHINLCGAEIASSQEFADMILLLHTPDNMQNDHCLKIYPEAENPTAINLALEFIKNTDKPLIIADISHANGADNMFIGELLDKHYNISKIYGYAGWNTTGNTLGSVISTGISRFIAEKTKNILIDNFKKVLLVRFSDDWLYQTIIRQKLRSLSDKANVKTLKEELTPLVLKLAYKLNLYVNPNDLFVDFPWNRTFEVEVDIN